MFNLFNSMCVCLGVILSPCIGANEAQKTVVKPECVERAELDGESVDDYSKSLLNPNFDGLSKATKSKKKTA